MATCAWRPGGSSRPVDLPVKLYAGVGSRQTPPEILKVATAAAQALRQLGWILRSGHAPGADQAFERGAGTHAAIYLPWPGFESAVPIEGTVIDRPSGDAYDIAAQVHPAWSRLSRGAQALHARNAHQVLGPDLRSPVSFLTCWTPDARVVGGTATAIRIANSWGVRVQNLADPQVLWRVERMIESVRAEM